MAIRPPVYHPTPSQYASAATHLAMRSEWRTVRIGDVRYVVLVSGNSGRVYYVRADAEGCGCVFYVQTARQCSHMLSVELAAIEDELAEAPVMANLYQRCAAVGCEAICESRLCDDCAAIEERGQRMAAARRRVVEEWTS